MIITTAGRTSGEMVRYAKEISKEVQGRFVIRGDNSIKEIQRKEQQHVLVVGKKRMELYPVEGDHPFFFHPNSSMFRMKRLMKSEHDPFIEATKLEEGMSVLDCTLGMASDSITASFIVGEKGKVEGIEGDPSIAYLVKKGLQQWKTGIAVCDEALRRVVVKNENYGTFLQKCEDNSFDVVYFDPMFEETIATSNGIDGMKQLALYTELTAEVIQEAKRVAKHRVVLKDHFRSQRFSQFGFHVYKRKSAVFHFGVIEIKDSM